MQRFLSEQSWPCYVGVVNSVPSHSFEEIDLGDTLMSQRSGGHWPTPYRTQTTYCTACNLLFCSPLPVPVATGGVALRSDTRLARGFVDHTSRRNRAAVHKGCKVRNFLFSIASCVCSQGDVKHKLCTWTSSQRRCWTGPFPRMLAPCRTLSSAGRR